MRKIYKLQFYQDKDILTLYAGTVNPPSFLGLIEVSDIMFMGESDILVTPNEDKIRNEFKNVESTYLPVNSIVRIDYVNLEKETPVIRLHDKNK
ncbi:Domain of unknown function DUF1820 [Flexistipes sinusarabici DSM 4947]|uniref:DUF1820 family protein n=1 Tax=Flexistipes sinusarabici (strain ATCC 49648 / DSM 4947 / MAS 10) TaxID=717231 RepID=F8E465_FLESM|nr:DUF1820 family protein [Flexistipes sinusarabici]AEI14418.1 Domain of unknown function DUF1820 [Flexistipes sinusarabici DSM 4947]